MKSILLTLALLLNAGISSAADLTSNDSAYLDQRFGVRSDNLLLKESTSGERVSLHDMIVEPWTRQYPGIRDARVQSFLYGVYNRQCGEWARSHTNPQCPPVTDVLMQAGKNIADRQCNTCHLFGTAETPPFFTMARAGDLTEARLSGALAGGHRMSPITLSADQIHDLLIYIQGLK